MRDLVAMIGTATTTTRRAVRCRKHAFALSVSFRPGNGVPANVTLPAQGHFSGPCRAGLASEFREAGGDPVNNSDPTGLHVCNGDPLTWGGCAENGVQNVESWALTPAKSKVQQTISGIESAQSSSSAASSSGCISGTGTSSSSTYGVVASIVNAFRLPDYISLEVSGGAYGIVGGAVATLTRYGSIFVGPELGAGVPGISGNVEAGWIDQGSAPGRNQLNGFVDGNSITGGGYLPAVFGVAGPAAAEVYGNVGSWGWSAFGTQVGIGIGLGKNLALQWSYSFHVSDSGPTW